MNSKLRIPLCWKVAACGPGGVVALSGVLDEQLDAVVAAYAGCTEVERATEGGWGAVVLRRDAS